MKYIIFKSKILGDTKINLTEAIDGKKIMLNESVTKDNLKFIQEALNKELNLADIKKEIEDTVEKALSSSKTEKAMETIVANCLIQLYKQLWTKRGVWVSGIKNKSS